MVPKWLSEIRGQFQKTHPRWDRPLVTLLAHRPLQDLLARAAERRMLLAIDVA